MPDVHDGHPAPRKLTTKTSKTTRDELYIALSKGTRVVVSGRLKLSRWEDKNTGEKRSAYGLDVDEVGPSLRFATAKVQKMSRAKAGDGFTPADVPNDDWSIAAPAAARPAA